MTDADHTQKLRTVALCFGGGGLDVGLARVLPKLELSLIVEIEAYAVSLALSRMVSGSLPTVPIWTDLKTLRWDEIAGAFDVLTGGFPCQPFSQSGKRKGSDDPRHLWPYIANGIRIARPKLCVFENVDGILSKGLGDGYEDPEGTPVALHVLKSLERLGYKATFAVSSADEAGHRHARKRVFFVGIRGDVDVRELGFGELPNTYCSRLQTQGTEQQTAGTSGSNPELADSQSILLQGCSDGQREKQSRGSGTQLADSDNQGLQGCECSRGTNASGREITHGHPSKCSNPSVTERVLGKGYLQWGWEYPRTYSDPEEAIKSVMGDAVDGVDAGDVHTHREDILRMLGNGVVPDTAEIAIRNALIELSNQ